MKSRKILLGIGFLGFLIGGAGLDGSTFAMSAVLAAASFLVAAVGYRSLVLSEQKEAYEKARKERRRKEIEAAEEALQKSKETTFQVWLESCGLDVQV